MYISSFGQTGSIYKIYVFIYNENFANNLIIIEEVELCNEIKCNVLIIRGKLKIVSALFIKPFSYLLCIF